MTDKKVIIEDSANHSRAAKDSKETDNHNEIAVERNTVPAAASTENKPENPEGSYEGRKHQPDIDGPEQASQETDEVYADPRKQEDLPPAGVNAGDLNVSDLSKEANK